MYLLMRFPTRPASRCGSPSARVGHERQPRFLALPLAEQPSIGVGRTLMRGVRALLAVEVDGRIAGVIGWLVRRRLVLGPEALEAAGRLDQRAVDREVLVREQAEAIGGQHHLVEELLGHPVPQQTLAVLAERARVEARLDQAHAQEPAEQQVVVQLLTEGPLAAHRVQADQQTGFERPLGGGTEGRPSSAYIWSN